MTPKILSYIDDLQDAYNESVSLVDGLVFNQKKTLRTIEFYSNNQFESGNTDGLGREKPFYNVCNYRVTVAKTNTDLDVKDIKFEPDSLKDSVATMLYNRELFKFLKETNFSETLNDMGVTRPKYGGLLVKNCQDDGELEIEVVEWKNTDNDPVDMLGGPIIETHWESPSEVSKRSDSWYEVDEFLKAHAKANKDKPVRMEIKEITGEFPESFDPDIEEPDETKFKTMCFYIGIVNKKKFYLYKEELKDIKDKYRYLAWEKIPGRALGRGIVEDGFESQVWINDSMITMKNAMELSGKVLLSTNSQKVSGNAITGVDHGHIFQLEPNASITSLNLQASSLPEFQNVIELWNQQYDKASSTYQGANTGEAPTAGTPYSQTALLNQVANSPFEYQREVWGIFLNEILNDWVLPHLKKKIMKKHYLVSEFDTEELKMIDEAISAREHNKMVKEMVLAGQVPTESDVMGTQSMVTSELNKFGNKREIEIPEKFLDVEGKITANITGELKNKAAILQSLDGVLKTVTASFNPNTGTYAVLENPVLSKIFGTIVEMAGIPLSFSQLKTSGAPDPSAISPVTPQNGSNPQPVA